MDYTKTVAAVRQEFVYNLLKTYTGGLAITNNQQLDIFAVKFSEMLLMAWKEFDLIPLGYDGFVVLDSSILITNWSIYRRGEIIITSKYQIVRNENFASTLVILEEMNSEYTKSCDILAQIYGKQYPEWYIIATTLQEPLLSYFHQDYTQVCMKPRFNQNDTRLISQYKDRLSNLKL